MELPQELVNKVLTFNTHTSAEILNKALKKIKGKKKVRAYFKKFQREHRQCIHCNVYKGLLNVIALEATEEYVCMPGTPCFDDWWDDRTKYEAKLHEKIENLEKQIENREKQIEIYKESNEKYKESCEKLANISVELSNITETQDWQMYIIAWFIRAFSIIILIRIFLPIIIFLL